MRAGVAEIGVGGTCQQRKDGGDGGLELHATRGERGVELHPGGGVGEELLKRDAVCGQPGFPEHFHCLGADLHIRVGQEREQGGAGFAAECEIGGGRDFGTRQDGGPAAGNHAQTPDAMQAGEGIGSLRGCFCE